MYFEDIEIGSRMDLGSWTFSEQEIIRYAEAFDPQFFHLDAEKAQKSVFGGLVASGFHICSIWMKLMIAYRDQNKAVGKSDSEQKSGVSPGFLNLRWPNPVRPGDTITYFSEVIEKVDLKSRPDLGIIRSKNLGINQNGEVVMSFIGQGMTHKRPAP